MTTTRRGAARERVPLVVVVGAVLAAAISVLNTPWACAAFLLNGLSPLAARAFPPKAAPKAHTG